LPRRLDGGVRRGLPTRQAERKAASGAVLGWQPTRIKILMAGSLEGNKIFAAVLTAGIIGVGSAVMSSILYHPHELEEPVYKVEAAATEGEAAGGDAAAEAEQPIGALLAAASVEDGEKAAKKCAACHSFEQGGANKVGPGLWNVVNRPIAGHEGFSYSEALAGKKDQVWDYEQLSAFLTNPKVYAPGTKMSFAGISKADDRADVIAYLRSLADQPAPLPGS
jgi:cytochrome c